MYGKSRKCVYQFVLFVGGLTAVIYTDTLQAFLMVAGAIALMILGWYHGYTKPASKHRKSQFITRFLFHETESNLQVWSTWVDLMVSGGSTH